MFPTHYLESRTQFRQLALAQGAETDIYPVEDEAGIQLSIDTAYFGAADAPTLLVVSSGTHGVEGYAGAACQLQFMRDYRTRYARSGVAFLLAHALNPWGYHHDRRVTSENVDLNRNFIDFTQAARPHSEYPAYHDLLVRDYRPLPAGLWNDMKIVGIMANAQRAKRAQAAVTTGQYEIPDGLFYGGSAPTRSRLAWERIVARYEGRRRLSFLLDLHTGLGKRGEFELISYLPPSSVDFRQMEAWFDGMLRSMAQGDSVSAAVEGTLTTGFDRQTAGRSFAVGLEFGTSGPLTVLDALRTDQWAFNNAAHISTAYQELARRKMKNAFLHADPQWQAQVLAGFTRVMENLTAGIGVRMEVH